MFILVHSSFAILTVPHLRNMLEMEGPGPGFLSFRPFVGIKRFGSVWIRLGVTQCWPPDDCVTSHQAWPPCNWQKSIKHTRLSDAERASTGEKSGWNPSVVFRFFTNFSPRLVRQICFCQGSSSCWNPLWLHGGAGGFWGVFWGVRMTEMSVWRIIILDSFWIHSLDMLYIVIYRKQDLPPSFEVRFSFKYIQIMDPSKWMRNSWVTWSLVACCGSEGTQCDTIPGLDQTSPPGCTGGQARRCAGKARGDEG